MNELLNEDIRKKQTCKLSPQGFYPIEQQVKLEGVEKLKFISYNVWFDKHNFQERNVELRKLFKRYDPDFICLQEVTYNFIQLINQDQEICNKYYFSSPSVNSYDVLILSKYPIPFSCRLFPSEMGRNLLFGSITINNVELAIGTTHLESLGQNSDYRQCQLEAIYDQFKTYPESILMGDLNFGKGKEDSNIPNSYTDVWTQLHPNDEGYTMPKSQYAPIRFDRVLLNKSQNWMPTHIEIIGKDPIPLYQNKQAQKYEVTTPSDHFGLYTELTFIDKK